MSSDELSVGEPASNQSALAKLLCGNLDIQEAIAAYKEIQEMGVF
jgi:hypothetical protein